MWEKPAAFGLATILVAALAQRGDRASRMCGFMLLVVWVIYLGTQTVFGMDAGTKIGAALDTFAAISCTLIWIVTGRCWPLVLMILFMMQETAHFAYAAKDAELAMHGATARQRWAGATHPMEVGLDVINVLQLLTVLVGPRLSEWARVLRRGVASISRRHRGVAHTRETST